MDNDIDGLLYPGHNYLGPGNPLNIGPAVDFSDRIAQEHDWDYFQAKTKYDIYHADEKAIKGFAQNIFGHPTEVIPSTLGVLGLGGKTFAEQPYGRMFYGMPGGSRYDVLWHYSKKGVRSYNKGHRVYADKRAAEQGRSMDEKRVMRATERKFSEDTGDSGDVEVQSDDPIVGAAGGSSGGGGQIGGGFTGQQIQTKM